MSSDERTPARLVLQRPEGEQVVYALEEGRSVTVGRDAENYVVLASRFVSKRHALVSWTTRGVRIEDQDSVNGIMVNGLMVQAAQLSSGDLIQIGDQRLVFEVEAQAGAAMAAPAGSVTPSGSHRGRRLILAALLTVPVIAVGLAVIYAPSRPAMVEQATAPPMVPQQDRSLPSNTTITPFDSAPAQAIEQQAIAARDKPADRLFDAGRLAYTNGRLLDAYRLLHGALFRDPQHEASRRLLLRVMGEREWRLHTHEAAAARADHESRFEEAAQQWAAVQALTLDSEPLNAHARSESARLRPRTAR